MSQSVQVSQSRSFIDFPARNASDRDILPLLYHSFQGVLGFLRTSTGTYVDQERQPCLLRKSAFPSAIDTGSHSTDRFALIAAPSRTRRRPVLKSLPGLFAARFIVHRLTLRYLGWFTRKSIWHNTCCFLFGHFSPEVVAK